MTINCKTFKELYTQFFEHGIGTYASNEVIIAKGRKATISISPIGSIVIMQSHCVFSDCDDTSHEMIICDISDDSITNLSIIDIADNGQLALKQWI